MKYSPNLNETQSMDNLDVVFNALETVIWLSHYLMVFSPSNSYLYDRLLLKPEVHQRTTKKLANSFHFCSPCACCVFSASMNYTPTLKTLRLSVINCLSFFSIDLIKKKSNAAGAHLYLPFLSSLNPENPLRVVKGLRDLSCRSSSSCLDLNT